MRRWLFLLPVLVLLLPVSAPAADLEIVRVFTGWRDAASFRRVSEYFDGRENTDGMIVLRSQPGERAGYYWLVRLKNRGAPISGAKFELDVILPTKPTPVVFTFPTAVKTGRSLFDLGVTGHDWPDAKARPPAWRLRLLAADGHALVGEQSFLWAMPDQ